MSETTYKRFWAREFGRNRWELYRDRCARDAAESHAWALNDTASRGWLYGKIEVKDDKGVIRLFILKSEISPRVFYAEEE